MPETIKVCPECGLNLDGIDVKAHALVHYPDDLDERKASKLALKRRAQLLGGGISESAYRADEEGG